jgi:hypothetical protein
VSSIKCLQANSLLNGAGNFFDRAGNSIEAAGNLIVEVGGEVRMARAERLFGPLGAGLVIPQPPRDQLYP